MGHHIGALPTPPPDSYQALMSLLLARSLSKLKRQLDEAVVAEGEVEDFTWLLNQHAGSNSTSSLPTKSSCPKGIWVNLTRIVWMAFGARSNPHGQTVNDSNGSRDSGGFYVSNKMSC
jgi:hypothetical protein